MSARGTRRDALRAGVATTLAPLALAAERQTPPVVNDYSTLNPVPVARVQRPQSTEDLRAALTDTTLPVSIGGARFSMGGQIAADGSLHLDMRGMRRLLAFDPAARTVRVQAGMRWRDLQDHLDPQGLAVKIMQSYSNFSIGGSLSVNCHGRYVGRGPLVNAVRALQLVTAAGEVLELSRTSQPALFAAVVGGYGGIGVVTEVELDLDLNTPIVRSVESVALDDYPAWFRTRVLGDPTILLHNADLVPPGFDRPLAVNWRIDETASVPGERLVPRGLDYALERNALWALTELPAGPRLRPALERLARTRAADVAWRNHEASLDVASLEPHTRAFSTWLLQEYFVPEAGMLPFARALGRILRRHEVEALNVSVRHSPADTVTLLPWAATPVFSFVLFYKQRRSAAANRYVARWTRDLVDAALAQGGRYYLPYRLDAAQAQFDAAYPGAARYVAVKAAVDPTHRFRNRLWDKYLRLG